MTDERLVALALAGDRSAFAGLIDRHRRPAEALVRRMLRDPVEAEDVVQEAIDAPAWHTEHFLSSFWPRTARPGVVVLEGRVPKATQDELKRRGHKVEVGPDWSEGRLTAASRDGKRRKAAANPRGMQGYAAGR